MKKLFIYYSDTGNCASVASYLENNGYDTRRATPKKDLPKAFFFKIMSGGFAAMRRKCAPLKDYDNDVSAYDAVVIGSPVWNSRLSAPVNTVLKKTDLSGKRTAFILSAASGEAPKALERLRAEYPSARAIVLREPNKFPEELDKLAGLFNDDTTI